MIQIKKFIDKVSAVDSRNGKTLIINIDEARILRDELAKLLADFRELERNTPEPTIEVVVTGGTFK